MYYNLRNALKQKSITHREYAEFLGVSEKAVSNKLNGNSDFTYSEYRKTCKFLLPEFSPDYLFATEATAAAAQK